MKTQYISNQYRVSVESLENILGDFENVQIILLESVQMNPAGMGHYKITAKFEIDRKEFVIKTKTSNMQLVDAWKSGLADAYEDGEDGFDNWDDVLDSLFYALNAEDNINYFIEE